MSFQVGDFITNTRPGHVHHGKTGQIISINSTTGGATVDWDGDGSADPGGGVNINASTIQSQISSQYALQNQFVSVETFANASLLTAIGIGVIIIGWMYIRRLVK